MSDEEPLSPGLSNDDVITLFFSRATNQPDVSSLARIRLVVQISPPSLSTNMLGAWLPGGAEPFPNAGSRLVLTITGGWWYILQLGFEFACGGGPSPRAPSSH